MAKATLGIELLAIYLPFDQKNAIIFNDFVSTFYFPILNLNVITALTSISEELKLSLSVKLALSRRRHTAAERIERTWAAFCTYHKDNLEPVTKIIDDWQLLNFDKVIHICSVDGTDRKVLHCEVKLYLYLLINDIPVDKNVHFSISKPLCMDCGMYFYSLPQESKPNIMAECSDHFPLVYFGTDCCV